MVGVALASAAERHLGQPISSISASGGGCCRSTCPDEDRKGANLSDAAGAHHRRLSTGRRWRHRGAPDGSMAVGTVCQPFIVENRPGAGGNIATEAVVRAPADGYNLLLIGAWNAINATLYNKLNFNFIGDIAPVAGLIRVPYVMEVNPLVPVKTVPEFIAYAKANPGKVNMASAGIGVPGHMSGELFKMMTGVNMLHVPYRGSAPALTDLLGGQVNKCKISLCRSDQALPICRRANAGAMRPANVRAIRRWTAGRRPQSRAANQIS
jgi:Tripartite tricarboxylate transporter family receptor